MNISNLHVAALHHRLSTFFQEADSSDYIAAINVFVLQHIETADAKEKSAMYQIMQLIELLAFLEKKTEKIYETEKLGTLSEKT